MVNLDPDAAQGVASTLGGDGHRGVGLDVTDTDAVRDACARIEQDLGPIEVLVNVAGWDRFIDSSTPTPSSGVG